MDLATLTANYGRKADFRHVVLIMKSNAGWREMGAFSPEFRNHLDAVVTFNALSFDVTGTTVEKYPTASIMSPMSDALDDLADVISKGLNEKSPDLLGSVRALFGSRYYQNDWKSDDGMRNRYAMGEDGVPFAALLNPDNPSSGAYGGFSLAWFPTPEGSLMTLVVGTRGLQPDEGILTRPGHRRRVAALRRYLTRSGFDAWAKADPASIGVRIPPQTRQLLGESFEGAYSRYGDVIYAAARVPKGDPGKARLVVQAFLDLYAFERGWKPLKAAQNDYDDFHGRLRADLFPNVTPHGVHDLLKRRRFVVLQRGAAAVGVVRPAVAGHRKRPDCANQRTGQPRWAQLTANTWKSPPGSRRTQHGDVGGRAVPGPRERVAIGRHPRLALGKVSVLARERPTRAPRAMRLRRPARAGSRRSAPRRAAAASAFSAIPSFRRKPRRVGRAGAAHRLLPA